MSTFEVKVYKLQIEPHNNADTLELAVVGDYRSCVRKGQFQTGDLGVYIPEGSLVPKWIIASLGLTGKLAGPDSNRVKAMKLRGILSQGLIFPVKVIYPGDNPNPHTVVYTVTGEWFYVEEGDDIAERLGITKYEPPIPVHMAGEVFNAHGYTLSYDIENIKKYPDVIKDGEMVLITEKLHGTWTCFGFHPDIPHPIVTSKGFSGQGLAFKYCDANAFNLYIMSLANTSDADGNDVLERLKKEFVENIPFYILGETYGKGVQDLEYGLARPHFRAFDIYVGNPGTGRYLNGHEFMAVCRKANIEIVPILFHGSYTRTIVDAFTNGQDNITGTHMREGVVVRCLLDDKRDYALGRVILKSVSEKYLLRKGNATEFN